MICLQEVWRTDLQRLIAQELRDIYPHAISLIDLETDRPSTPAFREFTCRGQVYSDYIKCVVKNCTDIRDPACPVRDCIGYLEALPYECRLCVVLNLDPRNPELILDCATDPPTNYERSFGLMVLSRRKVSEVKVEGYRGNISEGRGFIKAKVSHQ